MSNLSGPFAFVLLQAYPSVSPVTLMVLLLSNFGAFADLRYHKAGGKPSSTRDRMLFWSTALVVALAIALMQYWGRDPYGFLSFTFVPLALWFFFAWKVGRWRMRRRYPLPRPGSNGQDPPTTAP
jgi:hypothetical protein